MLEHTVPLRHWAQRFLITFSDHMYGQLLTFTENQSMNFTWTPHSRRIDEDRRNLLEES
jgi:hypothetical protein